MGKKFVVEEVRATGWSLRLRDTVTGETFDVPMNPGARFAPPGVRDSADEGRRERQAADAPSSDKDTPAPAADGPSEPRPRRKKKTHTNGAGTAANGGTQRHAPPPAIDPSSPWAPGKPNPLETYEGRATPIDEKSLTDADRKVVDEHQKFWAHVHEVKSSKRGKLGWEETTDAGRSGLRARHKAGAFKILHAGGDTYALFYEWDNGKFIKIACGKAEDMMVLADERTREKMQPPPSTLLDLEIARHMCSNDPQQRRIAEERLEPIIREGLRLEDDAANTPAPPTRRRSPRKATAPTPAPEQDLTTTTAPPPPPPAADVPVDAQRDAALMASFSQALAEMEDE
ncbi:MAG: hypothetical protein JNL82_36415 [Myxococcales bacterium]|nr:hypothetical protein [Myxococcales bacterium]